MHLHLQLQQQQRQQSRCLVGQPRGLEAQACSHPHRSQSPYGRTDRAQALARQPPPNPLPALPSRACRQTSLHAPMLKLRSQR